jgi:hypothetical protein
MSDKKSKKSKHGSSSEDEQDGLESVKRWYFASLFQRVCALVQSRCVCAICGSDSATLKTHFEKANQAGRSADRLQQETW